MDYFEDTLRLYSKTDAGLEFCHVFAYENEGIFVDSGKVGSMAQRHTAPVSSRPTIDTAIAELKSAGFTELDEDSMAFMDVVFDVKGDFADSEEFEHRNTLLEEMDAFLALTGQGWVDGASSGMGTMEISLMVVDSEISKTALETWLKETKKCAFKSIEVL